MSFGPKVLRWGSGPSVGFLVFPLTSCIRLLVSASAFNGPDPSIKHPGDWGGFKALNQSGASGHKQFEGHAPCPQPAISSLSAALEAGPLTLSNLPRWVVVFCWGVVNLTIPGHGSMVGIFDHTRSLEAPIFWSRPVSIPPPLILCLSLCSAARIDHETHNATNNANKWKWPGNETYNCTLFLQPSRFRDRQTEPLQLPCSPAALTNFHGPWVKGSRQRLPHGEGVRRTRPHAANSK